MKIKQINLGMYKIYIYMNTIVNQNCTKDGSFSRIKRILKYVELCRKLGLHFMNRYLVK